MIFRDDPFSGYMEISKGPFFNLSPSALSQERVNWVVLFRVTRKLGVNACSINFDFKFACARSAAKFREICRCTPGVNEICLCGYSAYTLYPAFFHKQSAYKSINNLSRASVYRQCINNVYRQCISKKKACNNPSPRLILKQNLIKICLPET